MDSSSPLTHISLCAGYGGIDLGLRRALGAVRTVAFGEIEAYACANLVAKIEAGLLDSAPVWTDIRTFPWGEFCGKVDIVSGGFPCQPFSTAGRRAGDEDPRHLFPHILRGLRGLGRPPIVFFENVEGIISSRLYGDEWADRAGTHVLLHVLRELERVGYRATASLFSAAEVGAPHQRKRVFILGVRDDLGQSGHDLINGLLEGAGDVGDPNNARCASRQDGANVRRSEGVDKGSNEPQPKPVRHGVVGGGEGTPLIIQQRTDELVWRADAYPAGRGSEQYTWEPPRTTGASKPEMGGDPNGLANRMGYEFLCDTVESRVDELRLLGNGVVPAVAERAFRVLWRQLGNPNSA